ncbi:MAG TPA: glucose 1-dehydrogenase [Actinomycetota bacterium]|nr:glucose 1-dehydrogenase [Actinomycetota bacterium]
MGRLDGKVALISGGARGQGATAAKRVIAEGGKAAIGDILDDEGKALAQELGDAGLYVHLDVTKEEDWTSAVADTEQAFGRLDILLNNAGILRFGKLTDMTLDEYMQVINVNQVGVFLGMKTVTPAMKRAGGGSIINISSVEGLRGLPRLTAYTASKFAVRGMSKAAAVELGRHKIRVNSIHPGFIDTPMTRAQGLEGIDVDKLFEAGVPMRRAGTPDDIVHMFVFLASDESTYCTGAEFIVDGGATSFVGWGGHIPRFS